MARAICLRLFVHPMRRAASRADCTAGRRRPTRTAMMVITTSNSIRVNPRLRRPGTFDLLIDRATETGFLRHIVLRFVTTGPRPGSLRYGLTSEPRLDPFGLG